MNQSNESRRARRRMQPAPMLLEDRVVLSAGQGSTFAIMPGSVTRPGRSRRLQFKLDPTLVHLASQRTAGSSLGIDVTPAVANCVGHEHHVDAQAPDRLGQRRRPDT